MGKSIHSHEMVAGVHTHGLLAHRTLIGVSWGLKEVKNSMDLPNCGLGME
jgi:hypothetical protein